MSSGLFITGTDTAVGKTWFTVALMNVLKAQGLTVAGMKPIASGAKIINGVLTNNDAEFISKHCSNITPYEWINPVVFENPVAPSIAADLSNTLIDMKKIKHAFKQLADSNDIVVVEGVGGWRVPLSEDVSLTNLVCELELTVILVVGLKLGCINHAILTAEAIRSDGLNLCGWTASEIDRDYLCKEQTLQTIEARIDSPMIAEMPNMEAFDPANHVIHIDLSVISTLV